MPLTKSIIISFFLSIIIVSNLSGCIFEEILGKTSFSMQTPMVFDDNGFPSIIASYSCSNIVNIQLINPESKIVDTEFFLKSEDNLELHIAGYHESVNPGNYKVLVGDKNGDEVYSKSFSFSGPNIVINSCSQKWWKQEFWIGGYRLVGLNLNIQNNGDTPFYPHEISIDIDSQQKTGKVIPMVILPGESEDINCFIDFEIEPSQENYSVTILDINGDEWATGSFINNMVENIPVTQFNWNYNGNRRIYLPYIDFLHEYFQEIPRYSSEDYGFYVYNEIDDEYIDILIDALNFGFTNTGTVAKINYFTSFAQSLDYKEDTDTSSDYPMYPIEIIFNEGGGGDCEDKAILTASLLDAINVQTALFRFDNHMAVGVKLSSEDISNYDFFVDDYYYLETTTEGKPCGFIPNEYRGVSPEAIYPITNRSLLIHTWKDDSILIYRGTELGDFVKVVCVISNLGVDNAEDVVVEAGYFTNSGLKFNEESKTISNIKAGSSEKVILKATIPSSVVSVFKTKIYLDDELVDERESIDYFP